MTTTAVHPYAITVYPLNNPEGQFAWKLRRGGSLLERSDRAFGSEAKAYENALKAIDFDRKPRLNDRF